MNTPLRRRLIYGVLFAATLLLAARGWGLSRQASVIVEWSTASELNTAGFSLFRAESSEGPFVQVNENLIPTKGDSLTGASYSFDDHGLKPGRTYYYRLEDVEMNGNTTTYGPIEIQAEASGRLELILALVLGTAGGIGVARNFAGKSSKKQVTQLPNE